MTINIAPSVTPTIDRMMAIANALSWLSLLPGLAEGSVGGGGGAVGVGRLLTVEVSPPADVILIATASGSKHKQQV